MTKQNPKIPFVTQERLKELFEFDKKINGLLWKDAFGRAIPGNRAGCISQDGYRRVQVDGRQYREDLLIKVFLDGGQPILPRKCRYFIERPLTHKTLLQRISYNPETGIFTWRERTPIKSGWAQAGDAVNTYLGVHGYLIMQVFGNTCKAHRLAWFYMTGSWPEEFVDHINGIPDDNRWSNLRAATKSENARNNSGHRRRKAPYKGISVAKNGRWRASITLGTFDTPEEANAAYMRAAQMFFGEFANSGQHNADVVPTIGLSDSPLPERE